MISHITMSALLLFKRLTMTDALSFTFDLVPIILAVIAIVMLRDCINTSEIKLARACAILLIICQSTWMQSYLIEFSLLNSIVDRIWTIFNSLAMILIVVIATKQTK